jgi:hypothetical protein
LFASGAVFEKPHDGHRIFLEATAMATSQTNPTSTPKFSPILEKLVISIGYICWASPGPVSGRLRPPFLL